MRWALSAFISFVALACAEDPPAGDPGGGAPSAGPIPETELTTQYAAAYCDTLGPCCGKYGVAFDKAGCTSLVQNAVRQPFEDAKARGSTYDADAAGKCIAAIRATITACDASAINPVDRANSGDSRASICRHIFSGKKKVGESCDSAADCAQPAGTSVTCAASVCREYKEGGEGAECKSSYDEDEPGPYLGCNGGLDCEEEDDKSFCVQPEPKKKGTAAEGAACKNDSDCVTSRCFQDKCFTDKMGIAPEACGNPLN